MEQTTEPRIVRKARMLPPAGHGYRATSGPTAPPPAPLGCGVMSESAEPREVQHLGFGGQSRVITADFDLGWGRLRAPDHGLRRAVWDVCHGYVSGFRKRDIAYYVLTRSFSRRVRQANVPVPYKTDEQS